MSISVISLFSDTETRPTDAMRAAIAAARVGDEQKNADPTVLALQERVGGGRGAGGGLRRLRRLGLDRLHEGTGSPDWRGPGRVEGLHPGRAALQAALRRSDAAGGDRGGGDPYLYAFDAATGEELTRHATEFRTSGNPMS
ncbi:MAG: PQQ-binding-like beta-propeller repeat protein [Acidobacteria bacterium]|nr:PQQ-binding-like beta-propeller repeat protein [Acidobacteriota bacterium]